MSNNGGRAGVKSKSQSITCDTYRAVLEFVEQRGTEVECSVKDRAEAGGGPILSHYWRSYII